MKLSHRSALALVVGIGLLVAFPSVAAARGKNTLSQQDQSFADKAWNVNQGEVDLGRMAEKKATNPEVKAFARRMIEDHSRLNTRLSNVVREHNGVLPRRLDTENRDLAQKLSRLNGADFDRQYMDAMINGHRKAIATFESESGEQAQTALDKLAGQSVPILKEHLRMAESTGKQVGAPSAAGTTGGY